MPSFKISKGQARKSKLKTWLRKRKLRENTDYAIYAAHMTEGGKGGIRDVWVVTFGDDLHAKWFKDEFETVSYPHPIKPQVCMDVFYVIDNQVENWLRENIGDYNVEWGYSMGGRANEYFVWFRTDAQYAWFKLAFSDYITVPISPEKNDVPWIPR